MGNCQPASSPTFLQVNEIKIKAIDTAKYSPLGNDDQSVVEDKPFDKTGMSMGDTDQSKLESLATDKAELSKGEADQSMVEDLLEEQSRVEQLLDVVDATDQSKVENLPHDESTRSRDDTNQPKVEHWYLEEHSPTDPRQPRDPESVAQSYKECCEVLGCCRNITSKQHAEDEPKQHAEADAGKSISNTSPATVSATTQLATSGIAKPGQPVKGQQLQAQQTILQVNEISIGKAETENNLPMEVVINPDTITPDKKGDTTGHGKPRPAHMVGRRLPINSFWMGLIILTLGWIIQLNEDGMPTTINQTVITDNPTLIIKGSITLQ
jgi:hypothetical protein